MTRQDVLGQAVDQCMKELYSYAQPSINWEDFLEENKVYISKEKVWEQYRRYYRDRETNPDDWNRVKELHPDWENKSIAECIGPKPFEYYFLPREILKDICENYVYAYNIDSQQQLLDIIAILKDYCKNPIVDKWIEGENGDPGHRGYDHPDNLEKEINKILLETTSLVANDSNKVSEELQNKFFEFLDKAGKFYNWNRDLNSFNMSVYLGASPNSNKEAVIENWKKYKGVDIEIDEEKMKKEYYGEDD
jgi:hypothetical protein